MTPLSRMGSHLAKKSIEMADKKTILGIGLTGRIGEKLKGKLISEGHKIVEIRRGVLEKNGSANNQNIEYVPDPAKLTQQDWSQIIKDSNVDVVINLAASSTGSEAAMRAVNVTLPEEISKACDELNIKMIHTCTYAAKLEGLNIKAHPYAKTKQIAADILKGNSVVTIARIGAVLGGQSNVPVCADAALSDWSPIIMLPSDGGKEKFHPIDEGTVIQALTNIVDHLTDPLKQNEPLPKVIDIAGEQISLEEFLRLVNPNAIFSVNVPQVILDLLAAIVDKGVFTKEFLNITTLLKSQDKKKVAPDTTGMIHILGVPSPSSQKVAEAARGQLSLMKTSSIIVKSLFGRAKSIDINSFKPHWPLNFLQVRERIDSSIKDIL